MEKRSPHFILLEPFAEYEEDSKFFGQKNKLRAFRKHFQPVCLLIFTFLRLDESANNSKLKEFE
jgi:hypothetical protein